MVRRIEVVPHKPEWSEMYHSEAKKIRNALDFEVITLYHIGSTSIPHIRAKPIIDILAEVHDIEKMDSFNNELKEIGYKARGENGLPGRRYYIKDTDSRRTHHLHIFQIDNPEVQRLVDLRDYLITHPEDADIYSEMKERLVIENSGNRDSYVDGKNGFIKELNRRAKDWKDSIIW
ncbi:MAG: GrpB family protein [Candidatus Thorarchaeota archaeon]